MHILGVKLRQPTFADLPVVVLFLAVSGFLVGICMFVFGWNIGESSTIIYGFTSAAIATACGVDIREHKLNGLMVVLLIMVALVATTFGLHIILK